MIGCEYSDCVVLPCLGSCCADQVTPSPFAGDVEQGAGSRNRQQRRLPGVQLHVDGGEQRRGTGIVAHQEHQIDQQLRQYVEGNFDQAKVAALAGQKAQIQAQLTVEETKIHNQLYQLLTDDQKTQLKQMEAKHENMFSLTR